MAKDTADRPSPLDVIERLAVEKDWSFERTSDDELTLLVTGKMTDYQIAFTWMPEIEAVHLACAFDLKVPARKLAEIGRLIALINEQMWIGHFDLWSKEGTVMFRHALVLPGDSEASRGQIEKILDTALSACEKYFPAFQFVIWAGKTAREALDATAFDTKGEG